MAKWFCNITQPQITLICSTFGTFIFQKGQVITNPAIVEMYPNLFTEIPELAPLQFKPAREIAVGQDRIRLHPEPICDVSACGVVEVYGNEPIDFVVATPDDPEPTETLPEESGNEVKRRRGRPFGSWGKEKREKLEKVKGA
jgi:hypothetical protein